MSNGRVTEWFKEPVLKTGVGQLTEGSNPSPSAKILLHFICPPGHFYVFSF